MYFTKLRVSGFKSFVEPTEFVIEPGLTGVVGPNGCGKSNLVEALRWVMGENRVKQMRGGDMDDVIFAGTTSRPSRNVAEVSLLIDNNQRKAPSAFNDLPEIDISRRIERGQGSIYRIGGRDVRARDVQMFFADAASGSHSPSLVSQGRIGAIINAKPTERRALLEEAAGITGLHSRRHEAELKLRAAEANLARLDDVLTTLDAQLQALKKQARQAARYRNLSDLIKRAESIMLTLRWREASAASTAASERLAEATNIVNEITGRAAAASTVLADAQSALPDLRKAEAEAAAEVARLTVAQEQLESEEQRIATALAELEARLVQIGSDRERERALVGDAETALARLTTERGELTAAEQDAVAKLADLEAALTASRADVEQRDEALAAATDAVAAAEAERAALTREIRELSERIAKLAQRQAQITSERDQLAANSIDAARQEEAAARVSAAEIALAAARAEAEAAEEARRTAQAEESAARQALQAAESELSRINAEVSAIEAVLKSGVASDYPPVIDGVSVTSGYEAALGAALGEDLSAALDDAAPMHWRTLEATETAPSLPSGVHPLSDYVKAPPALARRLAQIGVVDDEIAGAVLSAQLAQGQRLVSRQGGLWRWDGFTGKAGAPTAAATRLSQRNRLTELAQLREGASATATTARERAAAASEATQAAQRRDQTARADANRVFGELTTVRDEQARLARAAAAHAERMAGLNAQAERLATELNENEARRATAQTRLDTIADPTQAREQLVRDRATLSAERQKLAELQSTQERLQREREARSRRQVAIGQEENAWSQRADSAKRQIDTLTEREVQAEAEHERLASRPAEIAAERETLFTRMEEAEAKRRHDADRLAEAEDAVDAAAKNLKAIEADLVASREARVRAEGSVEQCERDQTELTQRIRERLDCAPEDALTAGGVEPGDELPDLTQINTRLERLIKERDTMGPVNLRADEEAREIEQQMLSLQTEKDDLVRAIARLRQGIGSLNREGRERLLAAFETVNKHFQELFVRLFGGGRAHLALAQPLPVEGQTEPAEVDPLDAGLEVMASPPGKKLQSLTLLSGGEQALTALALLFAVFIANPAPICVLDEVDAPLDDANVDRFCTMLEEIARTTGTRFIVVTHHRMTMARMDRLYGVTMAERGISQLVSVDLDGAERMRATA
jgi:chromosome segregation protein